MKNLSKKDLRTRFLGCFIVIMICLFVLSCANSEDEVVPCRSSLAYDVNKITYADAIGIANSFQKRNGRSCNSFDVSCEYITGTGRNSRASGTSDVDTLAYVLNFSDAGGFLIVSSDNRVYPVLAYSDHGSFSLENEVSKEEFIDRIEGYMEEKCVDNAVTYEYTPEDLDSCYKTFPFVGFSLSQRNPFDKYVVKEHPGCPVGCVAVATSLVMLYGNTSLEYHGSTYNCQLIREALTKGSQENDGVQDGEYTYSQAVDSVAKILYWIGKDLDMLYAPDGSGAYSIDAYYLVRSLDFMVVSEYEDYDIDKVVQYVTRENIVYMRGSSHAWICDGGYYCVDASGENVISPFIHCDWGWGGLSNGYFSGDVFSTAGGNMCPANYFAVRRDKQWIMASPTPDHWRC